MLLSSEKSIDWNYGVVAFIDVLGFSNFVECDAKSLSPNYLEKIHRCLEQAKSAELAKGLSVRAFSDSIVVAASLDLIEITNIFKFVIDLQKKFISNGVLIRGGIAFGKHFESDVVLYSEALIRAYQLERDRARFPRVLVDKNLLDWFLNDSDCTPEISLDADQMLLRDRDDLIFLSYLAKDDLEDHLRFLRSYDVRSVTPSVLEKLQWLASYHNYRAKCCGNEKLMDESLVIPFESIRGSVG